MNSRKEPAIQSTTVLTRKQKADARRDQIIDAALNLFSQKGFASATTSELAESAGIAEGLIYHYFDSKLALLMAVVERHGFVRRLRAMLTPIPEEPTRSILLRIAREWWSVLQEKRTFVLMVFGESQCNPELSRWMGEYVREATRMLTGYLQTRIDRGELRSDANAEVASRLFLNGIFMFFLQQSKWSPPLKRIAPETYFNEVVGIVLRGLQR